MMNPNELGTIIGKAISQGASVSIEFHPRDYSDTADEPRLFPSGRPVHDDKEEEL